MTHYELLLVLPGTMTEAEVAPLVEKVKGIVETGGGANVVVHDLGKNRLSYPMKHIRYGYFQMCRFEAEPDAIGGIQQKVRLVGELLRSLIQTYDPATQADPTILYASPPTADRERPSTERRERKAAPQKTNTVPEMAAVPTPKRPAVKKEEKKVSLEDIDKKLDEILDTDMADKV